ncbi:MAG: NINE protein [Clostridia bacterium]
MSNIKTNSTNWNRGGKRFLLALICFFFGWLGIDKLILGSPKLFIVKLLLNLVIIGEIWNIYDIICALLGKYKLNPLN